MLADDVKKKMIEAMKARDTIAKEILKVALGEMDVIESRTGTRPSDEEAQGVLRKLVKANEETLGHARNQEEKDVLLRELEVLASLLPKSLGVEETVSALAPVRDAIRSAKADGPGVGIAMKHLRSISATVDGRTVAAAVQRVRAG